MARTFKFSFPLPSRRQNYDPQPTPFYHVTDLPLRSPGSKAERLLGTSDSGGKAARNPPGCKEKKGHKHPSYMSVTVLETDERSLKAGSSTTLKPLHRLTSSPLPRTQHMHQASEWDTRSATDVPGIPPPSQSSSTLQSYYDSSKSPLSISQQTSASSARDMALRKGYPPIITPSAPTTPDMHGTLKGGKGDGTVKPKARPKHLNLQFSLSSLGYKPDGPVKPILSPNHVVRSPSPVSVASGPQQSGHRSRPKFFLWERKKSKESVSGGVEGPQELGCNDESAPVATEANWKTPPKVVGNRFDGVSADHHHPGGLLERPLPQNLEGSVTMARADQPRRHRLRRSKSSISELTDELEYTYPTRAHTDSASLPLDPSLHSQQLEEPRAASEAGGRRSGHRARESPTMVFADINLHEHSFLTLSSSDDETEDGEKRRDAMSRRHRIRASIAKADIGEEVIVCSAQRLTPAKPRPVVHLPRRKSSHVKGSDSIPPVPSIPARLPLNPRISSIRWREETKNLMPGLDTTSNSDHSWPSSRTSYSASRVSPLGSQRTPPRIENKMMAVTPEEEKLLEAMRTKRASIRPEARAEHIDDFNLVQRNVKFSSRPKTAGMDGPCETCYFESERSVSPSLASGPVAGRPTRSPTASADHNVHDEPSFLRSGALLCRCPARSSSPGGPGRVSTAFSDSGMSIPHLSFNPSDILPSTPAMSDATGEDLHGATPHAGCASPLTPPLDHGPLDLYASELGADEMTSHSEPILVVGERGYDRKRTGGNRIVVLDSTYTGGRDGRTLVEDNGMTSWAMDRW